MGIQNFSKDILVVTLPEQPHTSNELERINEIASNNHGYDVLIDFSKVKILTSSSVCNLMILRELLSSLGRQFILCNVTPPVRNIFTITGLEGSFQFAKDKFAALDLMQRIPHSQSRTGAVNRNVE